MSERTLVFIKPDGIQKKIVGRVLSRYEDKGFNLVAMRTVHMTPDMADRHYPEHIGRPYYAGLRDYVTSAPVLAFVLEGERVISIVRKMNGVTDGAEAESGTIRGDFSTSRGENIIHASDSTESAAKEIANFFPELK